jgi:hypothetical protein
MASPLPTRRVLSPLNVNSPITKVLGECDAQNINSLTKPRALGESISLQTSTGPMSEKVHGEALVAGEKRSSDAHEDGKPILSNTASSRKRIKTAHSARSSLSLDESRHDSSHNNGSEEQAGRGVRVFKDDLVCSFFPRGFTCTVLTYICSAIVGVMRMLGLHHRRHHRLRPHRRYRLPILVRMS